MYRRHLQHHGPAGPHPGRRHLGRHLAGAGAGTGTGTIVTLALSLNISHTYQGDLKITLTSPTGIAYIAHIRTGGSVDNVVLVNVPVTVFNGQAVLLRRRRNGLPDAHLGFEERLSARAAAIHRALRSASPTKKQLV